MRRCLSLVLLAAVLTAADGVDQVIALGSLDFDGSRVAPGTTLGIQAGERPYLILTGLVGTAERPIVVGNVGGLVRLANTDRGYALIISGCTHVRVTGAGVRGLEYGISAETRKDGMMTVHVNGKSTNIEVDHVEVTGAGFAGFNVKDEPKADGSTNRGTFVMEDIHLHHNYVHDTKGEGFYVGHTFYAGYDTDGKKGLLPHVIRGLRLHHNLVVNTGCEGIQIGSTVAGLEVHDNIVIKPGQRPFADHQDNGMQINAAGEATIWNNLVIDAPSTGIISSALEADYAPTFHHNVIVRSGGSGVYVGGSEGSQGTGVRFFHNTVIGCGGNGLRLGNKDFPELVVVNNLFVANKDPGFQLAYAGPKVRSAGNLELADLAKAGFRDPAKDDFDLLPGSPAVGRGEAIPNAPFTVDVAGRDLTRARAVDIGAYSPSSPALVEAAASATSRPTTPASPRVPVVAVPEDWAAQTAAPLTAALAAGRRISFPLGLFGGTTVDVLTFDGKSMAVDGGGMQADLVLAVLPATDAASLVASLANGSPNDEELKAFAITLLTATGRAAEALRFKR